MDSASQQLSISTPIEMTTPNPPVSDPVQYSTSLLPPDRFRTVVALAIIALTIGGWIYVLMIPVDRFALSAQGWLWWVEQIVGFVLALVCIGIVMRRRSFLGAAFWLTIYSMVFDLMRWFFQFKEGQLRIPLALILYALFIWRLQLARRTVTAETRAVAV
jgi:hypothetical protein